MAREKDLIVEPELPAKDGSEIEALIDTSIVGLDNVSRPIFINQVNEDFLQLTVEDAIRLRNFLNKAIKYMRAYKERRIQ